jgi:vancomycin resistance protein VanJ
MSKGGFLAATFGRKGGYGEGLRKQTQAFWDHQKSMAAEIAALAKKETAPVIIAGDFNVPNHGQIYHSYRDQFVDAFEEAGSGYGLTFPGFTRNPLTFFGPWLRLDQIFCSAELKPVSCRAEPGRRSQHRSMVAVFSKEK